MAAKPCPNCGAIESCCATSQTRHKTANTLSAIVRRQSIRITEFVRELHEAKQVIADMRRKRL